MVVGVDERAVTKALFAPHGFSVFGADAGEIFFAEAVNILAANDGGSHLILHGFRLPQSFRGESSRSFLYLEHS